MPEEIIGKAFESAVANIAPPYLAEAETDEYPFIVYNQTVSPLLTKDGLAAFQASLTATIISDDPNNAENIANAVAYAVRTRMTGFSTFPETLNRDCTNGVWEITLTWTVRQQDMTPTATSGSGSGSGVGA